MLNMKEMCVILKIEVTEEQLVAGRFLESRGLSFCGHFGYENAVKMADDLFDKEVARIRIQ